MDLGGIAATDSPAARRRLRRVLPQEKKEEKKAGLVEIAGEKENIEHWVKLPQPGGGKMNPGFRSGFGASAPGYFARL
jgi:hypothetical protein